MLLRFAYFFSSSDGLLWHEEMAVTATRTVMTRSATKLALMRHNLTNGTGLCCAKGLSASNPDTGGSAEGEMTGLVT